MNKIELDEIREYVKDNIVDFHARRISILQNLTLHRLLNKNPYLFRAKNVTKASELIEETMSAFLSSSEEKLFGDFLEDLALFIASKTADGHKSSSSGVDLEFSSNDVYYLISVKSGTNWGNSSQHKKLAQDFRDAVIRLRQSKHVKMIQPVLGICYGKAKTVITRDGYLKVVGQNFWTLISGEKELYKQIIEPIGYLAKEYNENYLLERAKITNLLTRSFIDNFCDATGVIDWPKVVEQNSGNYDLDEFIII